MPFTPFANFYPELAEEEVRCLNFFEQTDGVPAGEYVFWENYCDDRGCDCRKVMINGIFMGEKKPKIVATIGFGWENPSYYYQWLMPENAGLAEDMSGSYLEKLGQQSEYANALLKMWKEIVGFDAGYVERLKRHYALFKKKID